MPRRQTLTQIAARRRARQGEEQTRARWLDYAQLFAVLVACIGLFFSGFSGFLQYQATKDQLKKSAEDKEREDKEDASLFDIRFANTEAGFAVIYSNYSRHSAKQVTGYLEPDDTDRRYGFIIPYVAPCTEVRLDYGKVLEQAASAMGKDANVESWDDAAVTYRDWEGKDWIQWSYLWNSGLEKVNVPFIRKLRAEAEFPLKSSQVEPLATQRALSRCP